MDNQIMKQALEQILTPFYLFDTDAAVRKIGQLKAALGDKTEICFAMKSNPFLVGALVQAADYFEVCSVGEFRICERANIPIEKIVLSGVYKSREDILDTLTRYQGRGTYTVESLTQWNALSGYAQYYQLPVHLLLRLSNGGQFGLEREEICHIIDAAYHREHIEIDGIQFFSGTQKRSVSRIADELNKLDDFLLELYDEYGFVPQKLEYGPGFPVDYFGGQEGLEDSILDTLAQSIAALRCPARVVLEIGREIAADCGSYFTTVVDVKCRGKERFCIVDGGIHQLNYYGQMLGMKTPPVVHWNGMKSKMPVPWTVCGSLCTMNDVLLKEHPFSGLQIGSCLVFLKTGAYSVTEGISLFLSHDLPQIVLYSEENGLQLARGQVRTDTLNSVNL